jgi:MYXO-CTERM domain-containing protein
MPRFPRLTLPDFTFFGKRTTGASLPQPLSDNATPLLPFGIAGSLLLQAVNCEDGQSTMTGLVLLGLVATRLLRRRRVFDMAV